MSTTISDKRCLLKTKPFEVEELVVCQDGSRLEDPYYRLIAPDWVNVLPISNDGHAILVRQYRIGVSRSILEVPGGVMDRTDVDPTLAAARELEEETGYISSRILALASIHSNPAILSNRCHFFLALNCVKAGDRKNFPDHDERISIEFVNPKELDQLVRLGRIDHSLSALCIMLAGRYLASQP